MLSLVFSTAIFCIAWISWAPQRLRRLPIRPARMPSAVPLARTGPVTAYPAATMLSWPIFSSTVIAARRFSILFIGEVLSW